MIGETIGNFKIVSRLGKGGMGEVYLAEHKDLQTPVAVKLLSSDISGHKDYVQRFFNEARIVSKIKHAGTVKIFDSGFFKDQAYLIMELLEGEALATRIANAGQLPIVQTMDIARQITSILDATHKSGVIHRDLKPDNIFLVHDDERTSGERVKILDFGIAKLSGTMAAVSPKTRGTMGTPLYMAPEQWGDSSNVDWRSDAYSLGCVMFEMACGNPPFEIENIADAFIKHTTQDPPAPHSLRADIPPALENMILRLLAKDADARATSLGQITRELDELLASNTSGSYRFGTPPQGVPALQVQQAASQSRPVKTQLHTPTPQRVTPTPQTMPQSTAAAASPTGAEQPYPSPPGYTHVNAQAKMGHTTLGGSAAELQPVKRRRSAVLGLVGAGVLAMVVVTIIVATHGKSAKPTEPAPAASPPPAPIPTPTPSPTPPPPPTPSPTPPPPSTPTPDPTASAAGSASTTADTSPQTSAATAPPVDKTIKTTAKTTTAKTTAAKTTTAKTTTAKTTSTAKTTTAAKTATAKTTTTTNQKTTTPPPPPPPPPGGGDDLGGRL